MNKKVLPDNILCKPGFYIPNADSEPGSFGFVRSTDVHTGVDLYLPEKTVIHSLEDGEVVWYGQFTGEAVGSPWWTDTWAIAIKSKERILVYGELFQSTRYEPGDKIKIGQNVGYVKRVIKKFTKRPRCMLHLEEYELESEKGFKPVDWRLGDPMPIYLKNPVPFLESVFHL